jgi:hypothetical protein
VKGGEKGILILAPKLGKRRNDPEDDHSSAAAMGEESRAESLLGFRPVYVWDLAQTEGEPLPEFATVRGTSGHYLARLVQLTINCGLRFGYSEMIAPAMGVSRKGHILLRPDLSDAEQFSTLVHELAHALLHQGERRSVTTRIVGETEAEAIAFVVSQAVGLKTGTAASDYIQLYHGDAKLLASLQRVQQTASWMLTALQPEASPTSPGVSRGTPPEAGGPPPPPGNRCIKPVASVLAEAVA